jgi:hypothetical protein
MQTPRGASRLDVAGALRAADGGADARRRGPQLNGKAFRSAGPLTVERCPRGSEPECEAGKAERSCGAGTNFIDHLRTSLALAVKRVAELAEARRRCERDERLIASFDDDKLRDIGLGPAALGASTRWPAGGQARGPEAPWRRSP